jgi:hypothetical protein
MNSWTRCVATNRVELVHWTLKTGGKTMLKRMKLMFLFVNAFIYLFLLALIIIFITLQANTSTTDVRRPFLS